MKSLKNNKEIKTGDLKLSDYDQIWTKFCFLDETGTLSDRKDQYFTVGILKMSQPYYLQSRLHFERSKAKLGINTFAKGFKNHNFNVFVDKTDHLNKLEDNKTNEKGLSS